jgi:DNA-binding NtrC family response regulator
MRPRRPEHPPHAVDIEETAPAEGNPRASASTTATRLVVVYPRTHAGVHLLDEHEAVLGRHAGHAAQVAVAHPTVSRRHATLRWDPDARRHSLADLGSRNGTWLNQQPVSALPRYLDDQAIVRVGSVIAVYEREDGTVVDPPAVSRTAVPGDSLAVQKLRAAIGRAGPDPSPALILGETGAGKESVAAELHRLSGRRGPQMTINCAALSPQLVESQLFGHTRGAFTGATQEHPGMFRAAHGGTLFLDELGELPIDLQPKLLRAVELGEVVAVGSTQTHRVDVRLVAATNRSLLADIEQGKFRRDLYARLALWEIAVPPLRARRSDLLGWIDRLHAAWAAQRDRADLPPLEFQPDAAEALLLQSWPDNLRGLQRFVHACSAIADPVPIHRAELGPWLANDLRLETSGLAIPTVAHTFNNKKNPRPRPTREALLAILQSNGWSIRATAKHYERDRKQISRWIEMYAIDVPNRSEE